MGVRHGLAMLAVTTLAIASFGTSAAADGTETLGAPSIAVASGSGVAVGGTGTEAQPATLGIDVPSGATVQQVLLYWNGFHSEAGTGADDTISVDSTSVNGTLIGGPTLFFGGPNNRNFSSTYRADITGLGVVGGGSNSLAISDMDFDRVDNGAGVLVIYDDGTTAEISLVDGQDLAFINFASPIDGTVAQTFTFTPEPVARTADLGLFFSSVTGQDLPGDRPTVIRVVVDGVVNEYADVLNSVDGAEWDTVELAVAIPAGVSSVEVQAFSEDVNASGNLPASFNWNAAVFTVATTPPPPPGGGEGCTPGYWKQKHHFDSWVPTGLTPGDDYDATFGVTSTFRASTVLQALKQGGGKDKALGRHSVAALLNASNADVSYAFTPAEVIALVQQAYASGDFNGVKDILADENEMGCPLN